MGPCLSFPVPSRHSLEGGHVTVSASMFAALLCLSLPVCIMALWLGYDRFLDCILSLFPRLPNKSKMGKMLGSGFPPPPYPAMKVGHPGEGARVQDTGQ